MAPQRDLGLEQFLADEATYWLRHPNRWEAPDVASVQQWELLARPIPLSLGTGHSDVIVLEPPYLMRLEQLGQPTWERLDSVLSDRVVGYRYDRQSQRIVDYREPYLAEKERLTKASVEYPWVAKADIQGFFGSIGLTGLVDSLTEESSDFTDLVGHLRLLLGAGLGHLPPGSSTARLLANWWLAPLDADLEDAVPPGTWSRCLNGVVDGLSRCEECQARIEEQRRRSGKGRSS